MPCLALCDLPLPSRKLVKSRSFPPPGLVGPPPPSLRLLRPPPPHKRLMLAAFKHAVSSLKEVAAGGVPRGVVTLGGHRGSVRCVAFSPDGRHAATASGDNTLAVWDLRSASKRLDLGTVPENLTGGGVGAGHRHIVTSVAFSPDGGFVVSASHDKTLRVWSMQDGSALATFIGHMQIVTSVQFQPTASAAGAWRLLSASVDSTVRLWRLDHDGESDWSLFPWGNGVTLEFAFAHTQASFLSDDHADSEHFRRRTNRQRKHLPAMKCDLVTLCASSPVVCSQFTEDGERIVAASSDGSIKVWATASALQGGAEAKVLLQIAGRGVRIESLSIFGSSPTHRQAGLIAVGCRDAAVRVACCVWSVHCSVLVPRHGRVACSPADPNPWAAGRSTSTRWKTARWCRVLTI